MIGVLLLLFKSINSIIIFWEFFYHADFYGFIPASQGLNTWRYIDDYSHGRFTMAIFVPGDIVVVLQKSA